MKMKRIVLTVVAVACIGMVSCKKEQDVKPSSQKVMGGGRAPMGNYDVHKTMGGGRAAMGNYD